VVDEPLDQAGGDHRLAEDLAPLLEAAVAGDDDRAASMARALRASLGVKSPLRCCRKKSSTRKLHERLHTHRTRLNLQVDLNTKAPTCGAFAEPSNGLERLTPSLPCAPEPLPWVARGCRSACLSRFRGPRICHRLPLVAPAWLHKRSIPVPPIPDG
jgi:hypothetical protein